MGAVVGVLGHCVCVIQRGECVCVEVQRDALWLVCVGVGTTAVWMGDVMVVQ